MSRASDALSKVATLAGVVLLGAAAAVRTNKTYSSDGGTSIQEADPSLAASQPGRGRRAASPREIPITGWKNIAWRTVREVSDDRIPAVAGGVVYFGLIAIFPTLAALAALYGLVADRGMMQDHVMIVSSVLPEGLQQIVADQMKRLASQGEVKLGLAFLFSFALALWSANAGTKAVIEALNVAYGEAEKRSFLWLTAISLFLTASGVIAALIAIACVVVIPLLFAAFGLSDATATVVFYLRWPALAFVAAAGFAILYRYAPSRNLPQWRWVFVGAGFAALAWLVASAGLSLYLSSFANFEASYGALGGLIAGLLWMWISVLIFLVGAELNAELERQTVEDSTIDMLLPRGSRGANGADTVGPTADGN